MKREETFYNNLCTCSVLNDTNKHSYVSLQNQRQVIEQFLPEKYSNKFQTPCWVSSYHIPHSVSERMRRIISIRKPIYKKEQTTQIIREVLNSKSQHSPSFFCLPNVYLAGFPKCGTTTLYYMIAVHPDVAKPLSKEGHFWSTFTKPGSYMDKQIQFLWYLTHFKSAAEKIRRSPKDITIDGSPSTIWAYTKYPVPETDHCIRPSMISSVAPNSKFIVIMRDPARRLHSDFWYFCTNTHWWHNGKRVMPKKYEQHGDEIFYNITKQAITLFQNCLKLGESKFECVRRATMGYNVSDCVPVRLGLSLYYYHLVSWLRVFPRKNFLFLRTEDLAEDSYLVMKKVWKFLGLREQNKQSLVGVLAKKLNTNDWMKNPKYKATFTMRPETVKLLNTFYEPHNKLLAKLLSDNKYLWK